MTIMMRNCFPCAPPDITGTQVSAGQDGHQRPGLVSGYLFPHVMVMMRHYLRKINGSMPMLVLEVVRLYVQFKAEVCEFQLIHNQF